MIEAIRRKGQRVLASSARRSAAQRDLPPAGDRRSRATATLSHAQSTPGSVRERVKSEGETVEARKAIAAPGRSNSSLDDRPASASATLENSRSGALEDVQTIAATLRTEATSESAIRGTPSRHSLASPTAYLARPAGRAALLWRRPALPSCWSRRSYFFFAAGLAAAFGAAFAAGFSCCLRCRLGSCCLRRGLLGRLLAWLGPLPS